MAPAATMGDSRGAEQVQALLAAIWPRDRRGIDGYAAFLGPLPCYGFSSFLRSSGGGLGQFWPISLLQQEAPRPGNASHSPVTYNALPDAERNREFGDAAFVVNCRVEDGHAAILITFVFV